MRTPPPLQDYYGHSTTAMHDMNTPHPIPPSLLAIATAHDNDNLSRVMGGRRTCNLWTMRTRTVSRRSEPFRSSTSSSFPLAREISFGIQPSWSPTSSSFPLGSARDIGIVARGIAVPIIFHIIKLPRGSWDFDRGDS